MIFEPKPLDQDNWNFTQMVNLQWSFKWFFLSRNKKWLSEIPTGAPGLRRGGQIVKQNIKSRYCYMYIKVAT